MRAKGANVPPGGLIPRPSPALDLDALIGGFQAVSGVGSREVNDIANALITVFQGAGGTINDPRPDRAIADQPDRGRDQAIGEVVKNTNIVLDTTVEASKEFDETV